MATTLLQKTRQRKMIYFGAIVVLFTVSLIHREFLVKPQAYRLQLREETLGGVNLTSSAIRLVLTGSRGLAVTMLWYNAMDKQKRAEWNELEMIVESITQLQPYFVTPWLYQSWNISFNVAVECDRPRDKYYYISRGIELLAEGERRNRGTEKTGPPDPNEVVFPGNPEMRHFIGFFYQLKIGGSDERLTMRSLLELSCIDPIERRPERFLANDPRGRKEVNLAEFEDFCRKYPRTIRRLREQLDYAEPRRIVQFLQEYKDIPSRFEPSTETAEKSNIKKNPLKQFPILPPRSAEHWPDPKSETLTPEAMDVYVACRTWYEFAQKPLPPPEDNPRPYNPDYDKTRYRQPKGMVTQLFRAYPARAQVYIADALESEGFFDSDGWAIKGWFDKLAARPGGPVAPVGTEPKYWSRLAWDKGFEMYKDFGLKNGLYIPPDQLAKLEALADAWVRKPVASGGLGVKRDESVQIVPEGWRTGVKGESLNAHVKLYYSGYFRRLSNYSTYYDQSEGERDPVTATARKMLFFAERRRKGATKGEAMLREYDQAWTMYLHAALKYPRFAQVSSMQEDLCEIHQRYLGEAQEVHREAFKKQAVNSAKIGFSPYAMEAGAVSLQTPESLATALLGFAPADWHTALAQQAYTSVYFPDESATLVARLAQLPGLGWREAIVRYGVVALKEKEEQQMLRVVPIRTRTGPLDNVEYYDGPLAKEIKEDVLFRWTLGAAVCQNMSIAGVVTYPGHEYFLLSRVTPSRETSVPEGWKPLISGESRRVTMGRMGLAD